MSNYDKYEKSMNIEQLQKDKIMQFMAELEVIERIYKHMHKYEK